MAEMAVSMILRAVDRASAPLKGVAAAVAGIGGAVRTVTGGLAQFGLAVQGVQTAAALITAPFRGVIETAAEFEKLGLRLEALEGSAAGAAKAMAWVRDFAVKTPLEVRDVADAYAALKNVGIDPTAGALQALTDANAKAGGSAQQLGNVVLAVSQMWGKARIQTEEMNQLSERSIPAWGALSRALGKSEAEVRKLAESGKLGRAEIKLLVQQLGRDAAGASEKFAGSWEGILSNLSEHWTNFRLKIAEAGVFDALKGALQGLLATLDGLVKSGTLQRLAELIGGAMTEGIRWAVEALTRLITEGGGVESLGQRLVGTLSALGEAARGIAGTVRGLADAWQTVAAALRPVIDLTDAYWRGYQATVGKVSGGIAGAAGWVGRQLGIGGGEAPAAAPAGAAGNAGLGGGASMDRLGAQPLQPLQAPRQQVGGEIVVRLEGAPKGSRVERVKPSGGIALGVELGLAMGG
jgi:tape measure domain-containing protein